MTWYKNTPLNLRPKWIQQSLESVWIIHRSWTGVVLTDISCGFILLHLDAGQDFQVTREKRLTARLVDDQDLVWEMERVGNSEESSSVLSLLLPSDDDLQQYQTCWPQQEIKYLPRMDLLTVSSPVHGSSPVWESGCVVWRLRPFLAEPLGAYSSSHWTSCRHRPNKVEVAFPGRLRGVEG